METVFSKQLQMLRKQSGITQEQLADKLGVTAQAVSKWENGSYPDGDLLPKIADIFDVSIDNLYGRGEERCVKSNMVYTLCKHMVYMLSITNEHKNELEMRAKPEWKVHFLCFASAKRGSFSIR